jgi:hypothetical protein
MTIQRLLGINTRPTTTKTPAADTPPAADAPKPASPPAAVEPGKTEVPAPVQGKARARAAVSESSTRHNIEGLLPGGTAPKATSPDPANVKRHRDIAGRTSVDSPLFVKGASASDVHQGAVGDCYFASAASSVAHTRPELLKKALTENPDGTVNVNVAGKSVRVDRDVPSYNDRPIYGNAHDDTGKGEAWWPMLEKGYAAARGGNYKDIEGSLPGRGLRDITGAETDSHWNKTTSANTLWKSINNAQEKKLPMVASTYVPALHKDKTYGTVPNHIYSVLGCHEENGQRYVDLRNPHGKGAPESPTGEFSMRLEDFKKTFYCVVWAQVDKK